MRILMVCHAAPCSPALGPARRHLHLFEELTARHTVSLITLVAPGEQQRFEEQHHGKYLRAVFIPKRPPASKRLRILGQLLTGHSQIRHAWDARVQRAIDRVLTTDRIDVVYISTVLHGDYCLRNALPTIGDAHNVECEVFDRMARIARRRWWKAYYAVQSFVTKRDECRLARRFSAVLTTSERDAEYFAAVRHDRQVFVVPNGVRVTEPLTRSRRPSSGDIVMLFLGMMSYAPNADGAEYFLDEILPRIRRRAPRARVLIVGADPPRRLLARRSAGVEVTGRVDDVRPYYGRANVFVVPLRAGGGTRQKVLEAMHFGVPVVSTTLGCEGLDVRHGESVLLADTPEDFAAAVLQAGRNRRVSDRLVAHASTLVEAKYDWKRIGNTLDSILGSLARPGFTV